MTQPRAWLLSAYRADSHAAWADWLVATFDEFRWRRFELPGRHFAWRIRGNPLSWLDALEGDELPDRIVATSMVDLATIRGLHPRLASVPTLLYFHENQFAYPTRDAQTTSVEAQMVQLYAALAADRIAFNSEYNRQTFVAGVRALLARLPDHVPADVGSRIDGKAGVLPVPIAAVAPVGRRDPGLIVWNHRWEYDRQPDQFAEAMIRLAGRGTEFRLALLGARATEPPAALVRLRNTLAERIVVDGRASRDAYRAVLARAGISVSTSAHEFQGLAMLEAASAGCLPLVPDALVYPEIYPPEYRYPAGNVEALVGRLQQWLTGPRPPAVDVEGWAMPALEPAWRRSLVDERTRFHEAMGRSRDA